ncbi:hypothetical protein Hypma_006090 [Hypsizygus marmoreus]|uniref:Uncharacterized protein n=1 Tax=Hypsizygus marmoreus TaxID=39966 RepID=A0A369K092_HYPMA|nr:hypothetical protein Hypma_006090 [Hypsizygus marmoreus]
MTDGHTASVYCTPWVTHFPCSLYFSDLGLKRRAIGILLAEWHIWRQQGFYPPEPVFGPGTAPENSPLSVEPSTAD